MQTSNLVPIPRFSFGGVTGRVTYAFALCNSSADHLAFFDFVNDLLHSLNTVRKSRQNPCQSKAIEFCNGQNAQVSLEAVQTLNCLRWSGAHEEDTSQFTHCIAFEVVPLGASKPVSTVYSRHFPHEALKLFNGHLCRRALTELFVQEEKVTTECFFSVRLKRKKAHDKWKIGERFSEHLPDPFWSLFSVQRLT